jgi:3-methyladenine DNA glycosylase AlkD
MSALVLRELRAQLKQRAAPNERRKRVQWEKPYQAQPKIYGIRTPVVRKLASEFYKKIKQKPKQAIFQLCTSLLESGYSEERTIAFDWAFRLRKQFEPSDFLLLETWLTQHVPSWGACDDLCTHALGAFLYQFPEYIPKTKVWIRSENRWVRRASAVCLIYAVRRKEHLDAVFAIVDALLTDPDVMVQKGYGWMLKEASNHFPEEVFGYVMTHRQDMPRTALRYAIEKLAPNRRSEAMART